MRRYTMLIACVVGLTMLGSSLALAGTEDAVQVELLIPSLFELEVADQVIDFTDAQRWSFQEEFTIDGRRYTDVLVSDEIEGEGNLGTGNIRVRSNQPGWSLQVDAQTSQFIASGGTLALRFTTHRPAIYSAVFLTGDTPSATIWPFEDGQGVTRLDATYRAIAPIEAIPADFAETIQVTYTIVAID